MPARNRLQTVSGGPQGDDAKVVILTPLVGEFKRFSNQMPKDMTGLSFEETEQSSKVTEDFVWAHVKQWNWLTDDDQPMKMGMSFDDMTAEEQQFLVNAVMGSTAAQLDAQKNLKT